MKRSLLLSIATIFCIGILCAFGFSEKAREAIRIEFQTSTQVENPREKLMKKYCPRCVEAEVQIDQNDLNQYSVLKPVEEFSQEQYEQAIEGIGPCLNTYMGFTTDGRYIVSEQLLSKMATTRAEYVFNHPEKFVIQN